MFSKDTASTTVELSVPGGGDAVSGVSFVFTCGPEINNQTSGTDQPYRER
jgi:hypothetical protein